MPSINKKAYFKKIGYEPHQSQWLFHNSDARFRVTSCGRRFGKSTKVARDLEPRLFIPKQRMWVVGPTYDLAEKEFRVIWDDLIIEQELGRDKRIRRAYNLRTGEMFIEFPWQTRIECRSAAHPEKLVGESLDHIILSEAAKHDLDTWERYLRPALSDKRGTADFPSTPEGYNWYHKLWLQGRNPDHPDYESWKFPSWLNRVVFPGGEDDPEIQLLKSTTSPEWFMQEIGADFASFVGKIYGEFDEGIHIHKHEFRPDWPSYGAFDWGFVNPLAFIEFQISPSDDIFIWREHYESYLTLGEHLRKIKERENPEGYRLDLTFGDAADPEAVQVVRENFSMCIADPKAKENWREGVDLVKSFLRPRHDGVTYDDYERPITRPKYFVDPSCDNHIREMGNYRSKENITGSKEYSAAGVAQKQDDHSLDAVRYGLVHLFNLGYRPNAEASEFAKPQIIRKISEISSPRVDTQRDPGYGVGDDSDYTTITSGMRF